MSSPSPLIRDQLAAMSSRLAAARRAMTGVPRLWLMATAAGALVVVLVAALANWPGTRKPMAPLRPPHPVAAQRHSSVKIAAKITPSKPATPSRPSAFAREQQMSPKELMERWAPTIAEAAKRFRVAQPWIRAVMLIESGGRTMGGENLPIVSSMGAMGLMQLMPKTYNDMRIQYGLGKDPYDPHDNIMAGAAYLRQLHDRYGYPAMFAAYNDGPGNLEARMMGRGLLPLETQNYMSNITVALARGVPGGATVKFTRPNGAPAMINAAAVVSVRAAFPGEYAPGVQTVITVGRLHQGVRENLARVRALIRAHGGGV